MQLDWFTVVAQMVNFLILVALLKRFLYGPITRAMDMREAHIAARLQEAEEKITGAEQQTVFYDDQIKALEDTRDAMLTQAKVDAASQRQELMEQARQEVQQLQGRWHETLKQEQRGFLHTLRQQAGEQVCAATRRVLMDLAHVDLEDGVIHVFLERLQGLDESTRQALIEAARRAPGDIVVRSAFPIPVSTRRQIIDVVHQQVLDGVEPQFVTDAGIICGIELAVPGCKIAWNPEHYLERLEERFTAALAAESAEDEKAADV